MTAVTAQVLQLCVHLYIVNPSFHLYSELCLIAHILAVLWEEQNEEGVNTNMRCIVSLETIMTLVTIQVLFEQLHDPLYLVGVSDTQKNQHTFKYCWTGPFKQPRTLVELQLSQRALVTQITIKRNKDRKMVNKWSTEWLFTPSFPSLSAKCPIT